MQIVISSFSPKSSVRALQNLISQLKRSGLVLPNPNEFEDQLAGGLADGMHPEDFEPFDLEWGTRVEREHADDPALAQEIAMDHLVERPDYYERLAGIDPHDNPEDPKHDTDIFKEMRDSVLKKDEKGTVLDKLIEWTAKQPAQEKRTTTEEQRRSRGQKLRRKREFFDSRWAYAEATEPVFCWKCGQDQNEVAHEFDVEQAQIVSANLLDPQQENKSDYSPFCDWCGKPFRGILNGVVPAFPTNIFIPDDVFDLVKGKGEEARGTRAYITQATAFHDSLGYYAGDWMMENPSLGELLNGLRDAAVYDTAVLVRVYRKSMMEGDKGTLEHVKLHEEGHGSVWGFFHSLSDSGGLMSWFDRQMVEEQHGGYRRRIQFERAVTSFMLSNYPEFDTYYTEYLKGYDTPKKRANEFFADVYAWHYQPFAWLPTWEKAPHRGGWRKRTVFPPDARYGGRERQTAMRLLDASLAADGETSDAVVTNADLFAALRKPYEDMVVWIEAFDETWEGDLGAKVKKMRATRRKRTRAAKKGWETRRTRGNPPDELPQPPQVRAWSPEDD